MNKRTAGLILALLLTAVFVISASAAGISATTYTREGKTIHWKFQGETIWKFPESKAAEISQLSAVFNNLYSKGFKLTEIRVEKVGEKWSVLIGKNAIYTISPEYAKSLKMEPKTVAMQIMSKIYEIIGAKSAAKLGKDCQINGKYDLTGKVAWYGGKFIGRKFANGERFTETHLTAASRTLPFGTLVRVAAPSGKYVVLRITDRFRGQKNLVLDISSPAAELIGIKSAGTANARITVIGKVDKIGGK